MAVVKVRDRFTMKITDRGVDIIDSRKRIMHFSALEALMLLDILKNEEPRLRETAEEARLPVSLP